jgi:hypothetical protein
MNDDDIRVGMVIDVLDDEIDIHYQSPHFRKFLRDTFNFPILVTDVRMHKWDSDVSVMTVFFIDADCRRDKLGLSWAVDMCVVAAP